MLGSQVCGPKKCFGEYGHRFLLADLSLLGNLRLGPGTANSPRFALVPETSYVMDTADETQNSSRSGDNPTVTTAPHLDLELFKRDSVTCAYVSGRAGMNDREI